MSVTFWAPDAPKQEVRTLCDSRGCAPFTRCGYCSAGEMVEWVSALPEPNMANGVAAIVLGLLGEPNGPYGAWEVVQMPSVRRKLIRLLASDKPEKAQEPAYEAGGEGTGQVRVISSGVSAERIRRHLSAILDLLVKAQAKGWRVTWG